MPITQAGRFAHEAIAVDPHSGTIYMTEDNFGFPSGFYRYMPASQPDGDGHARQTAAGCRCSRCAGSRTPTSPRPSRAARRYDVEWVDIDDPDPTFPYTPGRDGADDQRRRASTYVGDAGTGAGRRRLLAARGRRSTTSGVIYFTSTQGGGARRDRRPGPIADGWGNGNGQVWAYASTVRAAALVVPVARARGARLPRQRHRSATRGTIVLCEDNTNDNYIRGLTRDGQLFDIALNRLSQRHRRTHRSGDEFAGATFSPDGHTLFVNIQASAGMTFAIWGPWTRSAS